jgi:hypothetical protein
MHSGRVLLGALLTWGYAGEASESTCKVEGVFVTDRIGLVDFFTQRVHCFLGEAGKKKCKSLTEHPLTLSRLNSGALGGVVRSMTADDQSHSAAQFSSQA